MPPKPTTEAAQLEAMKKQIARLEAENSALKSAGPGITFRVSKKGAVSVYGLGQRYPVTLYAGQWQTLLSAENRDNLLKFIAENADLLSNKKDEEEEV